MTRLRSALLLGFPAVAGGCAGCRVDDPIPSGTVGIAVSFDAPTSCSVRVGEDSFSLPAEETLLLQALRGRAARSRTAILTVDATIPYRCFGQAVYVAQRAGFEELSFDAAAPE